jgi:hypothetical protein
MAAQVHGLMDCKSALNRWWRSLEYGCRRCGRRALGSCYACHQQQNGDSNGTGDPMGHCARGVLIGQPGKARFRHLKPHWKETVANVGPMCLGEFGP